MFDCTANRQTVIFKLLSAVCSALCATQMEVIISRKLYGTHIYDGVIDSSSISMELYNRLYDNFLNNCVLFSHIK